MSKLPVLAFGSHGRVVRQSLLIALAALIHVPIAVALLGRAAAILV